MVFFLVLVLVEFGREKKSVKELRREQVQIFLPNFTNEQIFQCKRTPDTESNKLYKAVSLKILFAAILFAKQI